MYPADPGQLIGRTLGHYRIEAELGQGGMGVVYRALDMHLDRPVAVKLLLPDAVANPERKRRFIQEAKAASALNHPNIVHVYDVDHADGVDFIALELVPGRTLDRLIAEGLPAADALKYAVQIADALKTAHGAGIVHRDIKPSNVIVNDNGLVKVLDFGLAKLTEAALSEPDVPTQTLLTGDGVILGTASYMSPEQASGKSVDARSDVFAFGAVLYEMFARRRAFDRGTALSTLGAIMYDQPEPLGSVAKDAPIELERIVERCLQKDPDRRFQSMADLRIVLQELQSTLTTISSRAAAPTKTGIVEGRSRSWWSIRLATAGAIVIAIVTTFYYRARPEPAGTTGEVTPTVLAGVVKPLTSLPGWETRPSWSPDGTLMAFSNNAGGSMDVFVIPVAGGDPHLVATGPADEVSPRWSPDGRFLAFARDPGTGTNVYVVPPLGGGERKLADTGVPSLEQFSKASSVLGSTPWSPDGQELLLARVTPSRGTGTAIWRASIATGELVQTTFPAAGESDLDAAWSFDGARLLFIRQQGGRNTLWTGPARGGGEPRMVSAEDRLSYPAWSSDSKRIVFTSARAGPSNLWEIDVDTGRLRQITSGPGWDMYATISRGGRLAYVSFNHQVDLYAAHLDARADDRLTAHTRESFLPSFSPDGRRIVYQSDRTGNQEIWMLDLNTRVERQLTNNTAADVAPDWSPDGRDIAFVSTREGKTQVWLMDTEGGSLRRLTNEIVPAAGGGWTDGQVVPRWSPGGTSLAFAAVAPRGNAVWMSRRDGSGAKPVLYDALYFDWYRDNHIIFTRRGENGATEIHAADLERGAEMILLREPAIELAVSRDSGMLLYTHAASHFGMNLFTVALQPGPGGMPKTVGKPRQVTDGKAQWHAHKGAWSPDGKTIVYTRDADQGDIHTIENYR